VSLAVSPEQQNQLKANFTATTFMFTDKGAGAKKSGTSITSGGAH